MRVGVRDLRNRTTEVIEAVRGGERVTLTVHGEPVADIVPHDAGVSRWASGAAVWDQLRAAQADAELNSELDALFGETLADE
jgi:prevent-host-death family protein